MYRCKWDIPNFVLKTPSAKKLIQETCEEALTQARGNLKKKVNTPSSQKLMLNLRYKIAASLSASKKLDENGEPTKEDDLQTCWHLFDLAEELTKTSSDGADVTASYEVLTRLALLVFQLSPQSVSFDT